MGLNNSKFNHKVTKVAPLEIKDDHIAQTANLLVNRLDSFSTFGGLDQKRETWERELPPLRETLYGRSVPVPRPIPLDLPMENRETNSIIKRHPPRKHKKLEPIVLPRILSAEGITNKEGAFTAKQGKEIESKVHTANRSSVNRQHLQNMRMRELRKFEEMNHLQTQAELKRRVHREAKIDKQKMREIKGQKTRENVLKNNEEDDFLSVEHDETFNIDHRNSWPWGTHETHKVPRRCKNKNNTLEMWFKDQEIHRVIYSDSSSSDSLDSWIREDARNRPRPALIRTRAEKIPTFDEFYDCDY
ncbi:factor associated with metabolism and energy [Pelobates fuscus]|uniref:factor associated with metabolism and energy n=1 Tax=Pelobates fuscus TaxID=191477 RepID=UPI002FE4DE91